MVMILGGGTANGITQFTSPPTITGNTEISCRNPKLWISETGGSDMVEMFLKQSDNTSEGFKLTYNSATGDSYINNVYGIGNLFLQTNSNTKVTIDASGRVTKPYQPAFYAYPSAGVSYTDGQVYQFNTVVENQGGCFNSGNGRFTAPVTGRYLINFHSLTTNDGALLDHRMWINGSNSDRYGGYAGNWSGHKPAQSSWLVRLNAGDYVEVRSYGSTYVYSAPHSNFNGYLIG